MAETPSKEPPESEGEEGTNTPPAARLKKPPKPGRRPRRRPLHAQPAEPLKLLTFREIKRRDAIYETLGLAIVDSTTATMIQSKSGGEYISVRLSDKEETWISFNLTAFDREEPWITFNSERRGAEPSHKITIPPGLEVMLVTDLE